jgi:hypothetical protein
MRVIATAPGYDNIKLREIGEEFDMPDNVFDKRPKLKDGKPSGEFYPAPSWFKKVEAKKAEPAKKEPDGKDLV